MNTVSIETYVSELRQSLGRTLSSQDAEEIAAEAKNHLIERADELQRIGHSPLEAESVAIHEFGELGELSIALTEGYPPKSPVDPRRVRFSAEIATVIMLFFASYTFSLYGGWRGIESAASIIAPAMPILMVPGLVSALGRVKYRRLRPVATLTRMSTYGLSLSILAAACLVALQVSGHTTLTSTYPMAYAFTVAAALMYWMTKSVFKDGKVYTLLRKHVRIP